MLKNLTAISKEDVLELFRQAQENKSERVDGVVLLRIIELVYFCGLKRGEILSLKIKDVMDERGDIRNDINLGKVAMQLPADIRAMLATYIDYLNKKGYPATKTAWLFPMSRRPGVKQTQDARMRKLHRDMKIISTSGPDNLLEKVRQAGIRNFYDSLPSTTKLEDRIRAASRFARCQEKYLINILESRKPIPEPTQPNPLLSLQYKVRKLNSFTGADAELLQQAQQLIRDISDAKSLDDSDQFLKKYMIKDIKKVLTARNLNMVK
jgi:hypothetical protein